MLRGEAESKTIPAMNSAIYSIIPPPQTLTTPQLLTTMDAETPPQHNMTTFTLLGPAAAPVMAPRLGSLSIAGRKAISTPHYIPLTTRGTVSHIAHDVMRDHTAISSLYIGLEDCMLSACLWEGG